MSTTTAVEGFTQPKPSIESIKQDFLNWRRNPNRSSRIPEQLWDKVFQFLALYPKGKVLCAVGISHAQYAQKLKTREQAKPSTIPHFNTSKQSASHFVQAVITSTSQNNTQEVVFSKPNGTTLRIQKLSLEEVFKLAEQFMR